MASGYVSGHQHQLIDEEELTKERFAELCDKWFYHLGKYEMNNLDELDSYVAKEVQGYEEKIDEYKSRLTVLETNELAVLSVEYEDYVANAHKANVKYREQHERETERLALVRHYAKAFSPHLDYVWDNLEDPELFQVETLGFDAWRSSQIKTAKHSIDFYTELKTKANARNDLTTEAGRTVQDYEQRKQTFLSTP